MNPEAVTNIAYICHPAHGHIDWGGVKDLLQELGKNYNVTVYSGKKLEKVIKSQQLNFVDIGLDPITPVRSGKTIIDEVFRHMEENFFNAKMIINAVKITASLVRKIKSTIIISDPYCHVAQIVSHITYIPYYTVVSPVRFVNAAFIERLSPIINRFQQQVREEFGKVELNLNLFYPVTHHSPLQNFNFSAPEFNYTNKVPSIHLGGKMLAEERKDKKKTAYFSTGTLFWSSEQLCLLEQLIAVNHSVRFIITSSDDLFTISKYSNASVHHFIDEEKNFSDMDLIITQGGMGTVNKAIRAGVPILDLPVFYGNYAQGLEINKYGNGICLESMGDQRTNIFSAFCSLIEEKKYKVNATKLQKTFALYWDKAKINNFFPTPKKFVLEART